ncbi:MAG: hypothetical protein ABR615_02110 [Pseudonocardiaceae bacterium]
MSRSDTTQHSLLCDVEAVVAAIMADAPIAELITITNGSRLRWTTGTRSPRA